MFSALSRWVPVLAWMTLIFVGSGDSLSAAHTSRFVEPLLRWLFHGISQERVDDVHFLIRKGGHVTEYGILALLFCLALRPWAGASTPGRARRVQGRKALLLALALTACFAASDEFHQSFVSSRGASFHDVVIDTCGATAALSALCAWRTSREKRLGARH